MRVNFIGDVHGKTDQYQKMLRQRFSGQTTFQLGDMGIGFSGTPGLHKDIMSSGNHMWIRGNHDDPDACARYADRGYMGKFGYIEALDLFYLGGAFSIDYMGRIPGKTWWAGEENSYPELAEAINLYEKVKPKYVASHDTASSAGTWLLTAVAGGFRPEKMPSADSRTAVAMEQMFQIHKPEEWVFGHYHVNKSFHWRGTKFTCVNELSVYTITDEPLIVVPDGTVPS